VYINVCVIDLSVTVNSTLAAGCHAILYILYAITSLKGILTVLKDLAFPNVCRERFYYLKIILFLISNACTDLLQITILKKKGIKNIIY
jgi:hypothetical protein